jgi:hypothetical protein
MVDVLEITGAVIGIFSDIRTGVVMGFFLLPGFSPEM